MSNSIAIVHFIQRS